MSEAEQPIAKSDLPTRFAMGVVMAAVACAAIYIGDWVFRILVLAAAAVMLLEWTDMHRVPRLWAWVGAAGLAILLLGVIEYLYPAGGGDVEETADGFRQIISPESFDQGWVAFGVAITLSIPLGIIARRVTMTGGFLYVAIPSVALLVLSWARFDLVFWVMIVTWATDICAYFAGRAIGGPKLAPRLSPNKTWAGLIGGMAGAALFGWLTARFFDLGAPFLYVGGAMGIIAQAGDLYESWLKRRAGVKDSGTILPGHGGALDRLDGLLPVVVATFLILSAGLWTA